MPIRKQKLVRGIQKSLAPVTPMPTVLSGFPMKDWLNNSFQFLRGLID
jgi:hypothetical protein